MFYRFGLAVILLTAAYGLQRMFKGMLDWEDEESFYIGARCLITAVSAFVALIAVALIFGGGAE